MSLAIRVHHRALAGPRGAACGLSAGHRPRRIRRRVLLVVDAPDVRLWCGQPGLDAWPGRHHGHRGKRVVVAALERDTRACPDRTTASRPAPATAAGPGSAPRVNDWK